MSCTKKKITEEHIPVVAGSDNAFENLKKFTFCE